MVLFDPVFRVLLLEGKGQKKVEIDLENELKLISTEAKTLEDSIAKFIALRKERGYKNGLQMDWLMLLYHLDQELFTHTDKLLIASSADENSRKRFDLYRAKLLLTATDALRKGLEPLAHIHHVYRDTNVKQKHENGMPSNKEEFYDQFRRIRPSDLESIQIQQVTTLLCIKRSSEVLFRQLEGLNNHYNFADFCPNKWPNPTVSILFLLEMAKSEVYLKNNLGKVHSLSNI